MRPIFRQEPVRLETGLAGSRELAQRRMNHAFGQFYDEGPARQCKIARGKRKVAERHRGQERISEPLAGEKKRNVLQSKNRGLWPFPLISFDFLVIGMPISRSVPVRFLLLPYIFLLPQVSELKAEAPWTAEPFSAAPNAIASSARQLEYPDEEEYEILFQANDFRVEADGRVRQRVHRVWRVRTEAAAREWALLQAQWAPWYQQRPSMRARVIRPDGDVRELDPDTIGESAIQQLDPQLLIDDRILQAPLPGISAGCIVEESTVWQDSRPFFSGGAFRQFYLTSGRPIRTSRLRIEAPAGVPLRHRAQGISADPSVTATEEQQSITYEVQSPPAYDDFELGLPPGTPTLPVVTFSTNPSWNTIAKDYAEIAEARIDPAVVQDRVGDLLTGDESRLEVVAKLLAGIRETVRYTGVEF